MLTSQQILEKYINFFKERGHKQIPSVPLIPENDPTLLFVNSGMFPLAPYLSGEKHPIGTRLVNVQRAIRLEDIEEVGDHIHTTAFHMIGNWSLGDYFKEQQLHWVYEFLIEELNLDPNKLYASVFQGDENAPKDKKAIEILKQIFSKHGVTAKENERIFSYGNEENWWQRGDAVGELGGPDSEIFYFIGKGTPPLGKSPADDDKNFIEIGNSVFMQFEKTENGWKELSQKNVDFGGGLERLAMVVQEKNDIFETDNFRPIIEEIEKLSGVIYAKTIHKLPQLRILADHIRASVFLAMDGVNPSNKDQGYILRRLLRRMVRAGKSLGIEKDISVNLVGTVCTMFAWLYPDLPNKQKNIEKVFTKEEEKFRRTLAKAAKHVEKALNNFDGDENDLAKIAFTLYQSLGYPLEMFLEDAKEKYIEIKEAEVKKKYAELYTQHQKISKKGAEKKFKGGLADQSETTIRYHTVTHLLQQTLRKVLGNHIQQEGSNITDKRLRFDFSHKEKLSEKEIQKIEAAVNKVIEKELPVKSEFIPKQKAIEIGALYLKNKDYEDPSKIYYVGETLKEAFSIEFCGGPHVSNTKDLSPIEIYKQDKIGAGKMRIYARFS